MAGTELVIKPTGEVATNDAINAYLAAIVNELPDTIEGDMAGILTQIINATQLDDLDSPWQSAGMKKYRDHAIEITSIKRMESTFPGPLGFYILCEGTVMASGEYKAFTTSSASIMAQLLVAWKREMFPFQCYIRVARKPSKNGFFPMHLEVYRGGPLIDVPADDDAPAPGHRPGYRDGKPLAEHARERAARLAAAEAPGVPPQSEPTF